jgi:hypothetical protein
MKWNSILNFTYDVNETKNEMQFSFDKVIINKQKDMQITQRRQILCEPA